MKWLTDSPYNKIVAFSMILTPIVSYNEEESELWLIRWTRWISSADNQSRYFGFFWQTARYQFNHLTLTLLTGHALESRRTWTLILMCYPLSAVLTDKLEIRHLKLKRLNFGFGGWRWWSFTQAKGERKYLKLIILLHSLTSERLKKGSLMT